LNKISGSKSTDIRREIIPSATISFDQVKTLSEGEIERIRVKWIETFQGPENSGKFYVATSGRKIG